MMKRFGGIPVTLSFFYFAAAAAAATAASSHNNNNNNNNGLNCIQNESMNNICQIMESTINQRECSQFGETHAHGRCYPGAITHVGIFAEAFFDAAPVALRQTSLHDVMPSSPGFRVITSAMGLQPAPNTLQAMRAAWIMKRPSLPKSFFRTKSLCVLPTPRALCRASIA